MFTGIIETFAEVIALKKNGRNIEITFKSGITKNLKVDQSVAHNGICLTVTETNGEKYKVTAIAETLSRTNLHQLKTGDKVNIERSLCVGDRLDGHIVQGHIDSTAKCTAIKSQNGSRLFTFQINKKYSVLIIEKGSIAVNGISLTIINVGKNSFSVAVIPYTFENTNLQHLKKDDLVNVEFDVVGKYVLRKS